MSELMSTPEGESPLWLASAWEELADRRFEAISDFASAISLEPEVAEMTGVENFPTWMNMLKENSHDAPVLSETEMLLLAKVRTMAQEEFGTNTSSVNSHKMSIELRGLIDKFQSVVIQLKKCRKSDFGDMYKKWRPIRDRNVRSLMEISHEIKKKKEEANGERFDGTVTSLVAGVTAVAMRRFPVVALLAGGVAVLGSLAGIGATVSEENLIEEKIKRAKDIVDADRSLFNKIWSWLADSSKLQAVIDEFFQEMYRGRQEWKKVTQGINSILKASEAIANETDLEKLIKNLLKYFNVLPNSKKSVQVEISEVLSILTAFHMIQNRYSSLIHGSSDGSKIKKKLVVCAEGIIMALKVWPQLKISFGTAPKNSAVILSILLDILNCIKVKKEIEKGSPSKESENVKKIAVILKNEADVLRDAYYHIYGVLPMLSG